MDTFEVIRTIRSVREFDTERPVPEVVVMRILNAGRLSGSSKNTQPWQFILVNDRNILIDLAECGDYAAHLRRADFGIAILAEKAKRAEYDAGRCSQNMMLAAWNDGVGSCIATMHREADAKKVLGIPEEWTIQVVISFGYPTAVALQLATPPRMGGRKALQDVVHHERWRTG